jgi:hypothetical protein
MIFIIKKKFFHNVQNLRLFLIFYFKFGFKTIMNLYLVLNSACNYKISQHWVNFWFCKCLYF